MKNNQYKGIMCRPASERCCFRLFQILSSLCNEGTIVHVDGNFPVNGNHIGGLKKLLFWWGRDMARHYGTLHVSIARALGMQGDDAALVRRIEAYVFCSSI